MHNYTYDLQYERIISQNSNNNNNKTLHKTIELRHKEDI